MLHPCTRLRVVRSFQVLVLPLELTVALTTTNFIKRSIQLFLLEPP